MVHVQPGSCKKSTNISSEGINDAVPLTVTDWKTIPRSCQRVSMKWWCCVQTDKFQPQFVRGQVLINYIHSTTDSDH